ncbi:MAG: glycosyltransferase family 4 protein [Vicinamibacterales bacterium]
MRIAYINADSGIALFGTKGAAVHVRDVSQALTALGHTVRVFTARTGQAPASWQVPFEALPGTHEPVLSPEVRALLVNRGTFAALVRAHRESAWDLVYERYSLWSHAALRFARRYDLPFVLEVNSPLVVEQTRYRTLERTATARRIERYLFSGATRIVVVSQEVGDYVCAQGGDPSRVVVASNGVDLTLYEGQRPAGVASPERFTIGFLGSLKPWHGVDVLVDALEALVARDTRYHLRVVGDGPERAALEASLRARRLESHATIVGQVPREEVPRELAAVDCAVAPYPRLDDFYFSPLKVFEYMAAGRPIVASRIGQIEAVLEDSATALLVEPGNPRALADAIQALCHQPVLAGRLGTAARQRAFDRHGWTHTVTASLAGLQEARS